MLEMVTIHYNTWKEVLIIIKGITAMIHVLNSLFEWEYFITCWHEWYHGHVKVNIIYQV